MTVHSKSAALGFIFTTLLIDTMGFGLVIPVLPSLIQKLTNSDLSKAAQYGGWLITAYSIMQFFCAPLLGNLSDRFGRRPIILISLLGFGVDYIFLGFAPTLGWLFLGRAVAGITGASFTTASAYIADISTPENRTQNFGMVGVAFGVGFILGPLMGGSLAKFGLRVPFFVAAGFSILNAMLGFFILPESLSKDKRRKFEWSRANPFGAIRSLAKYPALSGMFLCLFFIYLAAHSVQTTWAYFTKYRFGWTEAQVGYSLAFVGLLIGLVQGVLIRPLIPRLGNRKSLYIGLILYALGCGMFAFATQSWMIYAILIPYCLGGIAGPAIQSIMSGSVSPTEQGELQGMMTSIMSLTSIFGPLLMTGLFAWATRPGGRVHFPGAPFLAGSLFLACSVVIAWLALRGKPEQGPEVAPAQPVLTEEGASGLIPDEPRGA
jgi:MFS transporter, DHA1 family, tetracycline resistance protein